MDSIITRLDLTGWAVLALCAMLVGISKTGMPGFGIIFVPLMAMILPARQSTGVLLGMLILGDIFAASYYHRAALWGHILKLIPAALVGILAGYMVMEKISDSALKRVIAIIVLSMLGLNALRGNKNEEMHIHLQFLFAIVMGFLAGFTTMMANAAGPVMIVYLLAMRLPKIEFVGTTAWFFFIINWLKVPFSVKLGLITFDSVKANLFMLPFIILGSVLGIGSLKKMPQKFFEIAMQLLTAIAAINLLIPKNLWLRLINAMTN